MMTKDAAIKKCVMKYGELWGADWVDERVDSLSDDTYISKEENKLYFGIAQDDRFRVKKPITFEEFSKIKFGGNERPQHYTKFSVDLKTGELEIIEHY